MKGAAPAALLAGLLALAGCVSTPPHDDLAAPKPRFSPAAFFSGPTHGVGRLHVILSKTKKTDVFGNGHVTGDGTLVLDQRVSVGGKPFKRRTWRIHPVGHGRYAGTLSDAEGTVAGDVHGNLLHLRFTAKGGYDTEQWLYLQPGGRVALNRMVVRKFGLPVAALDETITKTR